MASNGSDSGKLLIAGGSLSIWAGVFQIFTGVALVTGFSSFPSYILSELSIKFAYMEVPLLVLGIVAIVGGVSALRRKSFGLSLAGAICAIPSPFFVIWGILAVIFVALSKREFEAES
jgi:hypothetical protein